MIHHLDLPVGDLARSRAFYQRALAPLGLALVAEHDSANGERVAGFGVLPDPVFWIRGGRAPLASLHFAFLAATRDAVHAFHRAGIEAGGRDNGAPGLRRYAENYYAAFVLDPDGHNIEAVCREPV